MARVFDFDATYQEVKARHPEAGIITLYARPATEAEQLKYKHATAKLLQSVFKDKMQDAEKKLLQRKTGIGYGLVVGLKAPEKTKTGELKDGFAKGKNPVFCNPDTGECYPDDWKKLVLEKVPNLFDAVADRQCSSVYTVSDKEPEEVDLDDDDPFAAGAGDVGAAEDEEGKK